MRRFLLVLLLLPLALSLAGCYPSGPRWTTDSDAAREELEAGLDAEMKLYWDDARDHYAQAVKLDPGFLVAMERLGHLVGREQRQELAETLRGADLSNLSVEERFLVLYWLARMDQDPERAETILEERLEEAPKDPFALHLAAQRASAEGERERAVTLNQRLIAVDPNWVYAQNMLGYLAMEDGDFRAAEEQFKTYQYIAPDQANPHDSMGELLVLLGRYEEAEKELATALAVHPAFSPPYVNLLWIALFKQDPAKAQGVLDRVAAYRDQEDAEPDNAPQGDRDDVQQGGEGEGGSGGLEEKATTMEDDGNPWGSALRRLTCLRDLHLGYLTGDWQGAWERTDGCREPLHNVVFGHHVLLVLGDDARAAAERATFQKNAEKYADGQKPNARIQPAFLHMDGNALLAAGDAAGAVEAFRQADALLTFGGDHIALFKLRNLGHLAAALATAGKNDEAKATWRRVAEINPHIRPFLETGLAPLIARGVARGATTAPPETTPPPETTD
jgi:tetratricopeptide (TPR) repeat protein